VRCGPEQFRTGRPTIVPAQTFMVARHWLTNRFLLRRRLVHTRFCVADDKRDCGTHRHLGILQIPSPGLLITRGMRACEGTVDSVWNVSYNTMHRNIVTPLSLALPSLLHFELVSTLILLLFPGNWWVKLYDGPVILVPSGNNKVVFFTILLRVSSFVVPKERTLERRFETDHSSYIAKCRLKSWVGEEENRLVVKSVISILFSLNFHTSPQWKHCKKVSFLKEHFQLILRGFLTSVRIFRLHRTLSCLTT
jgi:hypothetical protein